jgi:hypothetical protein
LNVKLRRENKEVLKRLKDCEARIWEPSLEYESSRRRVVRNINLFGDLFRNKTGDLVEQSEDIAELSQNFYHHKL